MKVTQYNIVYTGVTAIGVSANPTVVGSAAANVAVVPVSSRSNPVNVFGQIVDGGVSTYTLQYTTADVYSPTFNAATAANWITVPSAPTTGTAPFNITAIGLTGIRLNVTTGPATVTLAPVFQADSSLGA
jgi:hypothetical protein